jgi:hypothetical protein
MASESLYCHVHIKAGWLSMCTACFFTTARAVSENDLVVGEKEHRCPGAFFKRNYASVAPTLYEITPQTRGHA